MSNEEQKVNPGYNIQRIITKEISFTTINVKEIPQETENPKILLDISVETSEFSKDIFEVIVIFGVKANIEKIGKSLFEIKMKTAGYFNFENPPKDENFDKILHIFCPTIIFPYMRETVDSCLVKAGLAPLLINPINFEALYLANKEKAQINPGKDTYNAGDKEELMRLKKELEELKTKVGVNEDSKVTSNDNLAGLKAKTNQLKSKK